MTRFGAESETKRALRVQEDSRAGEFGEKPPKRSLRQWRLTAMLVALPAATIAAEGALDCSAGAATTIRLACYVALANDLGPLMEPGFPDTAAESSECEHALASAEVTPPLEVPRSSEKGARPVGTD